MEAGWIREIHPRKLAEVEDEKDTRLELPKGTIKLLLAFALLEARADDVV